MSGETMVKSLVGDDRAEVIAYDGDELGAVVRLMLLEAGIRADHAVRPSTVTPSSSVTEVWIDAERLSYSQQMVVDFARGLGGFHDTETGRLVSVAQGQHDLSALCVRAFRLALRSRLRVTDAMNPAFAGPCPRCGSGVPDDTHPGQYPGALSRLDNKTYICSQCGQEEVMWQFTDSGKPLPPFGIRALPNGEED